MKIMLLAGGAGTRLWPYSKENLPKQLLNLHGDRTLLQQTISRFLGQISFQDIFIITSQELSAATKEQARQLAPFADDQILIEPCAKNTAPAIAFGLKALLSSNKIKKDDPILVVPTDHVFSDDERFIDLALKSQHFLKSGCTVAFGVKPLRADTGFGYFRIKDALTPNSYSVRSFVEKPALELAERLIESDEWYWNIGVYLFTADIMLKEFKEFCPDIMNFMQAEIRHEDYVFRSLSPISIDHAIIEKSTQLRFVSLDPIKWLDIGSWDNLYELLEKDINQNVKIGNVIEQDCKGCLLLSHKKPLSVVGLENCIVVEANDAVLVLKRNDSQKIKDIVQELKQRHELLVT